MISILNGAESRPGDQIRPGGLPNKTSFNLDGDAKFFDIQPSKMKVV